MPTGLDPLKYSASEPAAIEIAHSLAPASMQIVCGTDFSKNAMKAAKAATALAARLREPLNLVHVFDEPSRALLPKVLRDSLRSFEQQQLHDETERLAAEGRMVHETFCDGDPSEMLSQIGARPSTRMIVLSSGKHTASTKWILGSVAETVTHTSSTPTLLVRDPAPLVAWAQGKRKLRVFGAADFSIGSDAALNWLHWLRQFGNCDITVAYIEQAMVGDGVFGPQPSPGAAPLLEKIERTEKACFRRRVREFLSTNRVRVLFERDWGRSDAHLIQMARKVQADLIVVGMNNWQGLSRIAHHSVSRAILHYAPMSVACIPQAFSTRTINVHEK